MPAIVGTDLARMRGELLFDGAERGRKLSRFWALLVLATVIATSGVISDSTGTVIGAMIVAPFDDADPRNGALRRHGRPCEPRAVHASRRRRGRRRRSIARLGAKRSMLMSDAARGPLMLILPMLVWTGNLSFAAILVVASAIGCFTAPYFSSSRLVVPEVVGDDERRVAEVNAVLGGANTLTQIAGPVLAGVLIAATSPSVVLVVDACTYVFSFLTIAIVVRAGKRVAATEESKGWLAGLRYVMRDSLLGPLLVVACVMNLVVFGLIVGINALGYFQYSSARVTGFLFAAFGVGSLIGAVLAQQLVQKVDLMRLAAVGILMMPLPLWALSVEIPWELAIVALGLFAVGGPLVNAPVLGILTTKPPEALRPKVMTAVMTLAAGAGPLGFLLAGEALRVVSLQTLFLVIAALLTVISVAFAAVLLRRGREGLDAEPLEPVAAG